MLLVQGISELIKRIAVMRGLIPDPHASQVHAIEAEVEHLVEVIEKRWIADAVAGEFRLSGFSYRQYGAIMFASLSWCCCSAIGGRSPLGAGDLCLRPASNSENSGRTSCKRFPSRLWRND